VEQPEVRYTKSGDVSIAYAVVGNGPFDVVFISGWVLSNLAGAWDGTPAEFFEQMSSFCRLIMFDKRGTGLSDRVSGIPDLETRMDDVRAVMDAVGSKRAALLGVSEGGPMSMLFAATYPQRTAAAVLYGTGASFTRASDYPWRDTREARLEWIPREARRVGTPEWIKEAALNYYPSLAHDQELQKWFGNWLRVSASPGAAEALWRMNTDVDVRHVLPNIRVPTLVLHRVDDQDFALGEGLYLADKIPGAEFIELPGADHGWWVDPGSITGPAERFLRNIWERGEWDQVETERVLATVLFTDIVGSTSKLSELGDRGWREMLQKHHRLIRRQLARFAGAEMDTAGDGFFARFDGPARAIRCACAITDGVQELGLEVRTGLHTGECELVDGKVGGIAVHIGARVAHEAGPGEVLVSSTVRDLVAGSGIKFHERGAFELKGVPDEWRLYSVDKGSVVAN
jgi:pimeloyl-ACP methyl ester carboxylesterase/class 3 adenylate cyclase